MSAIAGVARQNNNLSHYHLERKQRQVLGTGSYSMALAEGHKRVLLVTTPENAEGIELVRSLIPLEEAKKVNLDIPEYVASDVDLASIINMSKREQREFQKLNKLPPSVWKINRVYLLVRYDDTVENLSRIRFKEDSLTELDTSISQQLGLLHAHGLVHSDVSKRNIAITGTYPNLKSHLVDFGNVRKSPPSKHAEACEKDMSDLRAVKSDLASTFHRKYSRKSEKNDYLREEVPSMGKRQRERAGRSPMKEKPPASDLASHSTAAQKRLF